MAILTPTKRCILSLDGGGIKGVFVTSFLETIERETGKRIIDYFDLIAGTSTGGIIALCLGLGVPAKDIMNFYITKGPSIFGQLQTLENVNIFSRTYEKILSLKYFFQQLVAPKYSTDGLREALIAILADQTLGDSKTRLLIPTYNVDKGDVYVFKTRHHKKFQVDCKEKAIDIALATSAAPTYFPAHLMPSGSSFIDGSIWANNPAGLATIEARGVLEWKNDDLFILSLGCTETLLDIPKNAGYKGLVLKIADLFMQGQSRASVGTAKALSNHSETSPRFFRYQHIVTPNKFKLDKVEAINQLCGLGQIYAHGALETIQTHFLNKKADPFRPIPL